MELDIGARHGLNLAPCLEDVTVLIIRRVVREWV